MTSTPETRLPRLHASRLDFDISMAFQPIVDVGERSIFAYEALVRGPDGAPPPTFLRGSTTTTATPLISAAACARWNWPQPSA
jgi:EAL domain-containing protein (putative c-di-GMP-specific phosphodiesterase class I)